jgi:hypothetical protein
MRKLSVTDLFKINLYGNELHLNSQNIKVEREHLTKDTWPVKGSAAADWSWVLCN